MKRRFYFLLIIIFINCFDKPLKPDLPPEIEHILPLDNSVVQEGEKIKFFLKAYDEENIKEISLYIDDSLYYRAYTDSLLYFLNSTGLDGDHQYYFNIIDHKGASTIKGIYSFKVNPFNFSILSPENLEYINDWLNLKFLLPHDYEVCRSIKLFLNNNFYLKRDFALSFSEFIDKSYNDKILLSVYLCDSLDAVLDSQRIDIFKINNPILSIPDTVIISNDSTFKIPIEISDPMDIFEIEFKILYEKNYIMPYKVELTDLTKEYIAFSVNYLSSPDQIYIQYFSKYDHYINEKGTIFYINFKRKDFSKFNTKLRFIYKKCVNSKNVGVDILSNDGTLIFNSGDEE